MSTIDPQTAPDRVQHWLRDSREQVDAELTRVLDGPAHPENDPVSKLAQAMRYAVLSGGKRLRPALVLAACQACGGSVEKALPAAAAIELLHAYTLVHDDLPSMDDDDERRGRPSVHIQYDEATAILTGDALQAMAFQSAASLENGAAEAVLCLARFSGRDHLLGGQMLDLEWQDKTPSFSELERLHRGKTGALFAAACQMGAIASGADKAISDAMARYGMLLGVAFQHADDLDDGDFPVLAENARTRRVELATLAKAELGALGDNAGLLRDLVQWFGHA